MASLLTTNWREPELGFLTADAQQQASMALRLAEMMQRDRSIQEKMDFEREQDERVRRHMEQKQALDMLQFGEQQRVNDARINRYNTMGSGGGRRGSDDAYVPPWGGAWDFPLPVDDAGADGEQPVMQEPTAAERLTMAANQGENTALAEDGLSLQVKNPFELPTGFDGVPNKVDFGGVDPDLGDKPAFEVPSMAEQLAQLGGNHWVNSEDTGLPQGGGAEVPSSFPPQMARGPQGDPWGLSPEAKARVDAVGYTQGKKAAQRVLMAELAQARKTPKAALDSNNLFSTYEDAVQAITDNGWDAKPQYDAKTGKVRVSFTNRPPITQQDEDYKAIAGWDTVGNYKVNPEDPTQIYLRSWSSRGGAAYKPVEMKTRSMPDGLYLIDPTGRTAPTKLVSNNALPKDPKRLEAIDADVAAAKAAREQAIKAEQDMKAGGFLSPSADKVAMMQEAADQAEEKVARWNAIYPGLANLKKETAKKPEPKEGKPLTRELAMEFKQKAGGDRAKAEQLAREAGYTF